MMDIDALRAHAGTELERWGVPGLELAVVGKDEVLLAEGFGLRDVAKKLPVTPMTRFQHGSTGKAFTGLLVGTLVDAGLLAWDRPVREYLPEFRLSDPVLTERITVIDLLSHRSGLARHEWMWLANPSLSRAEMVCRLRYLDTNLDLRTTFVYSNLAYVTVGHLIEAVTGSTWEEQMRERVLAPLGMEHTVISFEEVHSLEHALAYVQRGRGNPSVHEIPWREANQIAPAGQVISCAVDTARWLRLQLSDGEVDGGRIISAEALAATRRIRTPIDAPGPDPDIHFHGYGAGWVLGSYRGKRLVWHNGGIDGFKTDIAILPEAGIAAAASCNVLQTELPFALVFHVLDLLLGETPKPWSETLHAATAVRSLPGKKPAKVQGTQPSHALKEYAGEYEHPGYGTLRIKVQGRGLRAQLAEMELSAQYRHYDTWTLHYEPLEASWPLTFLTDPDGRIYAAEIPLEPSIEPIRFELPTKETEQ